MHELISNTKTMDSREIAKMTGKRHDNVNRDIEKHKVIDALRFEGVYLGDNGEERKCYKLPKRESMLLCMSYSHEIQAKIYDRWQELEDGHQIQPVRLLLLESEKASREFAALQSVARLTGLDHNESCIRANIAVRRDYGVDFLEKIGQTHLLAAKQEIDMTPTDIAKRLGVKPLQGNKLLIEHGLQIAHRDHKNRMYYQVTDKGMSFAKIRDTGKKHSDGTSVVQIRWSDRVISVLNKGDL